MLWYVCVCVCFPVQSSPVQYPSSSKEGTCSVLEWIQYPIQCHGKRKSSSGYALVSKKRPKMPCFSEATNQPRADQWHTHHQKVKWRPQVQTRVERLIRIHLFLRKSTFDNSSTISSSSSSSRVKITMRLSFYSSSVRWFSHIDIRGRRTEGDFERQKKFWCSGLSRLSVIVPTSVTLKTRFDSLPCEEVLRSFWNSCARYLGWARRDTPRFDRTCRGLSWFFRYYRRSSSQYDKHKTSGNCNCSDDGLFEQSTVRKCDSTKSAASRVDTKCQTRDFWMASSTVPGPPE